MTFPFVPVADDQTRHNFERLAQAFPLGPQHIAMRVVRGEVDAAGAVVRGTGFTSSRTAVGNYAVTFDDPFAAVPVVVGIVGATANPAGAVLVAKLNAGTPPSATGFVMNTQNSATGATVDAIFNFIAISV